jgi:hypothetical protein
MDILTPDEVLRVLNSLDGAVAALKAGKYSSAWSYAWGAVRDLERFPSVNIPRPKEQ